MKIPILDRLILIVPLVIPLALCVGVLMGLISVSSGFFDNFDKRFAPIFTAVISTFLTVGIILILRRCATIKLPDTPMVAIPQRFHVLSRLLLLIVFLLIGTGYAYLLFAFRLSR
jgi:hypothetical protein